MVNYFQIFVALFLIILSACNTTSDKQAIKINVLSDTTLVLKKKNGQGNVWGIDLKISGSFNDTIVIVHTNGNNVSYKYKLLGRIDSTYCTDWYSDSCLIKLENINEPITDFSIEYEFFD